VSAEQKFLAGCERFGNVEALYAARGGAHSPEWDYGVHWQDGVREWPLWRVSWVVETGDLYASSPDGVLLLGNVAKVGEYPYGEARGFDAWRRFRDAQPIEQVLEGWAEQPVASLEWVLYRLAKHETDRVRPDDAA
jgi:hypothetical protein